MHDVREALEGIAAEVQSQDRKIRPKAENSSKEVAKDNKAAAQMHDKGFKGKGRRRHKKQDKKALPNQQGLDKPIGG